MLDLKWIALIALILQNSGLALVMRYSIISAIEGQHYITSTAVLNAEIIKLIISSCLCFIFDGNSSFPEFFKILHTEFIGNKGDWLKLMVPSTLYTLQNSLQYYSMSCLSAPVFQVLYQMKIVTTAFFSVIILAKRLNVNQWISIIALTCGVALVQLSQSSGKGNGQSDSIAGLVSVMLSCVTSGFAGVYFELVLKSSSASVWLRNIQLSLIGIVVSLFSCYSRDLDRLGADGFFVGYNNWVWGVILLQALGGMLVAVVVKYADNVLKGFATSLSILISCAVSAIWFGDINLNTGFVIGAVIVLAAVYVYGVAPNASGSVEVHKFAPVPLGSPRTKGDWKEFPNDTANV